ncbi:hypothetical protein NMG60_11008856 [Bertholletia excelsa]
MSQTVVLKVGMSCQGCVGAVKRVLDKMEGVESVDIDLKEQKVTVKGNVQPEEVLQTVSKTGKKTSFWEAEAQAAPAEPAEAPATPAATAKPAEAAAAPAEAPAEPVAESAESAELARPAETIAAA